MATLYEIHWETPQADRIQEIVTRLRDGAVMLYPTDTVYAIGCDLNSQAAVKRVRQLKQMSNDKPLTFLCSSLSHISHYAMVTDLAYRTMKRLIPGPYTFLLPATKLVPRVVMNPKRKTTGIRVPDHAICQAILAMVDHPIISTSAMLPDTLGDFPSMEMERFRLFDALDSFVDVIIDGGEECGVEVSTILDFTTNKPSVVRRGLGWDALQEWLVVEE
ncbi:L-threonylcarbamoyladenylate synthase [Spirulina sp. CS-785/01]|uniref:L-threonylcarbamoyladenylate synthase n=1 Tax=Spirulina sp. CS-785/01 TaxID=3021716 RepID=UPI00232D988F|nr:L-threonylcarbamoyladenylate synthase [Spirulina sp. CS-785/01]MDB9315308.1 L-threonylcarbamoyladenylate synthase [Spirulina sp. CS-785/01]